MSKRCNISKDIVHRCDESHDSSDLDTKLITLLTGKHQNVCMIADVDQSIYGFRGANIDSLLKIMKLFKFKKHILRRNYRSTKTIVEASKSLIKNNPHETKKEFYSENTKGTTIISFDEKTEKEEAERIIQLVILLNKKYKVPFSKIGILNRSLKNIKHLEKELLNINIPYKIIGNIDFLSRQETKDLISYLKVLYNPNDLESFKRIINVPKRGIGKVLQDKIFEYFKINNVDLLQTCCSSTLSSKYKKLDNFNNIIQSLIQAEYQTVGDLLKLLIKETNYIDYIKDNDKFEEKHENIKELIELGNEYTSLETFLENFSINNSKNDDEEEENKECVNIMTIHASKGLEFNAVIMMNCNEGNYPHFLSKTEKEIFEERRIFYVGMTRAEKYLFFTRPQYAMQMGIMMEKERSRFLDEIDEKYIYNYDN